MNNSQKLKILRPNEKLNGVTTDSTMRNSATPGNNSSSDDFDNSSRIFKSINDVQRFLEVKRSKANTVLDLFTTSLEAQRMRLKSYCERLMFKDPLAYGREAKDILWKKCYYDVINTAKQLRDNSQWQPDELSCLQIHLQSGIGHYHHILQRFQQEYNISFTDRKSSKGSSKTTELEDWAYSATYCCLIHLGDLSRYKLDIYPTHNMSLPACYYYQALYWRPHSGLPHNQLATLYNAQAVYIDAAYHYFRCLNSPKPFEGTSCNLRILADKNKLRMKQNSSADSIPIYKLFVEHFVYISYVLYYDQPVKDEFVQSFISYFESCLSDMEANSSYNSIFEDTTGECSTLMSYTHIDCTHLLPWIQRTVKKAQDQSLDSRSLMKMMATFFLLCYRSKKHNSKKYETIMNLTFHLMSLILEHTLVKLKETMDEKAKEESEKKPNEQNGKEEENGVDEEEGEIKKILLGRRRRLRRRFGSNDSVHEEKDHKEANGEDSEEELLFDAHSSDDEADEKLTGKLKNMKLEEGSNSPVLSRTESDIEDSGSLTESCFNDEQKCTENIAMKSIMHLCETECLFQTIRLFVDWLSFDKIVLLFPSEHIQNFMRNYAKLLNILQTVEIPFQFKNTSTWTLTPLEEDLELRGMPPFHHIHYSYNWNELKISRANHLSQVAIRISRMKQFAQVLTTPNVDYLVYNPTDHSYSYHEDRKVPEPKLNGHNNGERVVSRRSMNGVEKSNGYKVNGVLNSVDREENVIHNLSHNMTQMSNNTSPNHFEEEDKVPSDDEANKDGETFNSPSDDLLSPPTVKQDNGLRLMQDMGQLWLKSEVNQIDSKIKQNRMMCLPPYLVFDTEAMTAQPYLIKQLVYTKRFIVLIPNVVIQELDELKRTSGRVRDTIRWLEVQLRSGNRFLRAQRVNEKKEIPFIKYPKKKDKEAAVIYQILECCYYLANKTKTQSDTDTNPDNSKMVTLITGHDKANLQHGICGVAASAGIDIENIITFYSTFKSISKSPG